MDIIDCPVGLIKKELSRRSLIEFCRQMWSQFESNWHHRLICRKIDIMIDGTGKKNLMIFAPPRHGKSQICTRNLPAYFLGRFPDKEVLCCSYSSELSFRLAKDTINIMQSDEYNGLFPKSCVGRTRATGKKKATIRRDHFEIHGDTGSYRSAGVGGSIVGMGFSLGIIDDPYKNAEEAMSIRNRDKVWDWYRTSFATRKAPDAMQVLIMTRWHHDDLAGRILKDYKNEWDVLTLPGMSSDFTTLDPEDPRNGKIGVPLWESRFDKRHHEIMKSLMGSFWYGAMYDQTPIPDGAGLFKTNKVGRFTEDEQRIYVKGKSYPNEKIVTFATVDLAASEKTSSDYSVISFFSILPDNEVCVRAVYRERVPVNDISLWIVDKLQKHPKTNVVGVEATGFQMAIIKDLRTNHKTPAIVELKPESKSKIVRATAAIIAMETGNVFLPVKSDWEKAWIDELSAFTGQDDPHDDMVDSFAYCFRMRSGFIRDEIGSGVGQEAEIMQTKLNKYFRR